MHCTPKMPSQWLRHQPRFLNTTGASPYVALHSMRKPRIQPGLHYMKYEWLHNMQRCTRCSHSCTIQWIMAFPFLSTCAFVELSGSAHHPQGPPNLVRTGSMFAACKAWIEGNLQPSSASRGERFLQAGKREKKQ